MSTLPPDIIEKILFMRNVFVVMKERNTIEYNKVKCLGIYNNLDDAKQCVIDNCLECDLVDFENYDPRKRFQKYSTIYSEKIYWSDRWISYTGFAKYFIEEWNLNKQDGLQQSLYFAIDLYIKNKIINELISVENTKEFFTNLQNDKSEWYKLFMEKQEFYTDKYRHKPDEWHKIYPHIEPFPYKGL